MLPPDYPPPIPPRIIFDYSVAIAIGLFSLLGALARMLVRWDPNELAVRKLGGLLASVYVAYIVGFSVAAKYPGELGVILPACGVASWGGAELMGLLLDALINRIKART